MSNGNIRTPTQKDALLNLIEKLQLQLSILSCILQSITVVALVNMHYFPPKLSPLIRPIMTCLRLDNDKIFQIISARGLCVLLKDKAPASEEKIISSCVDLLDCRGAVLFFNELGRVFGADLFRRFLFLKELCFAGDEKSFSVFINLKKNLKMCLFRLSVL